MRKTQLVLLSLLCAIEVMGQQILKHHGGKSWTQAQAHCRDKHTDLVTIRNDAENNQITDDSWLGLYRDSSTSNWKWSTGDPLNYTIRWYDDDPDYGENCVYKDKNDGGGLWRTKHCYENHDFYCFQKTDITVTVPNITLVTEMKTWEEALVHCRSMGTGPDPYELASVTSEDDLLYALSLIQDKVWTGLRFLGDQWVWVGGEEVQFNITECPSDQRCGMIDKTSTQPFNIGQCGEKRNFFCRKG